eukprot:4419017-Pyramimonas_sp.AAC.1
MGVNAGKLTNLGEFLRLSQMPWAVAADWNVSPSDLRRSKWPDLLGGYVLSPTNTTWTCNRAPYNLLDF